MWICTAVDPEWATQIGASARVAVRRPTRKPKKNAVPSASRTQQNHTLRGEQSRRRACAMTPGAVANDSDQATSLTHRWTWQAVKGTTLMAA